jgi:hypothetical protein
MNNVMHDVWYQYGFDEASGNFQANYGPGELGMIMLMLMPKTVISCTKSLNNANFSTPKDGTSGRMQMFLWSTGPEIKPIIINSPIRIRRYVAKQNSF